MVTNVLSGDGVDQGAGLCMYGDREYTREISIPSTQFSCDLKLFLKQNKVFKKILPSNMRVLMNTCVERMLCVFLGSKCTRVLVFTHGARIAKSRGSLSPEG